ncbi:hypothetical protein [Alloactinosynnema sp. L-07]|uniref:hypothetical protein n=1 Tax=Alloactinosynnema sp. L-07 TaxID=1653480 RepID=UPI0012F74191|nr:hypothetical protein [Alloactinosynnema sp. L-07]
MANLTSTCLAKDRTAFHPAALARVGSGRSEPFVPIAADQVVLIACRVDPLPIGSGAWRRWRQPGPDIRVSILASPLGLPRRDRRDGSTREFDTIGLKSVRCRIDQQQRPVDRLARHTKATTARVSSGRADSSASLCSGGAA